MTRQLVDVLWEAIEADYDFLSMTPDRFVASLLADGPAEWTIVCPTCEGSSVVVRVNGTLGRCPDCVNGRQTVIIRAEVKRG